MTIILFTLHPSLANPDKQGVWRGEEFPQLFTTLHLSSPISEHLKKMIVEIGGSVIGFARSLLYGSSWDLDEEWWRVVKSGAYSSPRQMPCLSDIARDGWRVKSISWFHCLFKSRNQESQEMVLCSYLLWQVLLCCMDSQLADMETAGCSR